MASLTPSSVATRGILGAMPEVESVYFSFGYGNAVSVRQDFKCLNGIFRVVQRFTHSHNHNVGKKTGFIRRTRPFAVCVSGNHKLGDNFPRRQISGDFLASGMAEFAADRTADLRGNTHGAAVFFRNIDRFNPLAV